MAMVWRENVSKGKYHYKINRKHPAIEPVVSAEHGEADKPVSSILSLVEDHLPYHYIVSRGIADESSFVEPPEEPTKDHKELANKIFEDLCNNGYTPEEARKQLSTTEPFHLFPAMIGALEKDTTND